MHQYLIKKQLLEVIGRELRKRTAEDPSTDYTDFAFLDSTIDGELIKAGIDKNEIDKCAANLIIEGYLDLKSKDGKKTMYYFMKEKGIAAITSNLFESLYENYQRDKLQELLVRYQFKSQKNQNVINRWLICATFVAGLVPVVTFTVDKIWFRDKVQFSPSIHIDPAVLKNSNDTQPKTSPPMPEPSPIEPQ